MDWLRSCYSVTAQVGPNSTDTATLTWSPAQPGAKVFEQPHAFGSLVWYSDDNLPVDCPGELYGPRTWSPNVPSAYPGTCEIAHPEWLLDGVPEDVAAQPLPPIICCRPTPVYTDCCPSTPIPWTVFLAQSYAGLFHPEQDTFTLTYDQDFGVWFSDTFTSSVGDATFTFQWNFACQTTIWEVQCVELEGGTLIVDSTIPLTCSFPDSLILFPDSVFGGTPVVPDFPLIVYWSPATALFFSGALAMDAEFLALTALVWDVFLDFPGTPLAAHTPNIGGPWVAFRGTWNCGGGNAELVAFNAPNAAYIDCGIADVSVSVQLNKSGSSLWSDGVCFNLDPAAGSFWFATHGFGGTNAGLYFYDVSGLHTAQLAGINNHGPVTTQLKVVTSGDNVQVWYDGILRINYTEASRRNETATCHGLADNRNAVNVTWQNFLVTTP